MRYVWLMALVLGSLAVADVVRPVADKSCKSMFNDRLSLQFTKKDVTLSGEYEGTLGCETLREYREPCPAGSRMCHQPDWFIRCTGDTEENGTLTLFWRPGFRGPDSYTLSSSTKPDEALLSGPMKCKF
ncbi:MAG: hypothetical protein H6617_09200 [Bdellovibrionaceae bacterium]|nr:hypothetical protein [Bdellovibrionales bacterium]MCB9254844.1 hypothetical protein [Pseudobdellovibrionaceae bacterium]